MENRIWNQGEGLSWSTITDALGDHDHTPSLLRLMTLDLTDELFKLAAEREMLQKKLAECEGRIDFVKDNLRSCIEFGKKRLSYSNTVRYIHDKEPDIVSIKVENNKIEVTAEKLTLFFSK